MATRRAKAFELHGESLVDEYAWLRERENPDVQGYLAEENAYAEAVLAPLRGLEERLYQEMLSRIKQTDLSVPYREGAWWYYSRTEEGKQYAILCRRRGSLDAPEEVLLDLNQLAASHSYMALGAFEVSPSGRYLAYSTDPTGFRDHTLVVLDLERRVEVAGPIPRVGSVAWGLDDATFYYTVEDQAKRDHQVFRGRLGAGDATLMFDEPDERFRVHVHTTRSRRFVVLSVASHTTSEAHVLDAADPDAGWRLVSGRVLDREYQLDQQGEFFYLTVNDTGPNFRVVRAPVDDPSPARWLEVLPHRDDTLVEHVSCFANHWVAWERRDGLPQVRMTDVETGAERLLRFPEPVYEAHPGMNAEYEATAVRYVYESFVTPPSVFDVDLRTGQQTLLKQKEVLGGYDPARYVSERLHARAPDGAEIPISLVRLAGADPATPQHVHLTGYGAYGLPYPVTFNSNRMSLVDRGIAVAIAHVRGGGELGRRWHDAGRLAQKMNTFTDFVAAIDHLVSTGRSRPDQLTIEGGSAGGLLMGATLNLRPECARAAILHVPFVDVVNTMLDASLPLTVGEYEEWGNPTVEEQLRWIRAYCPYTNLAAREYPAMLVRTSLNDSQVMFWEPAKYVARMRRLRTDDRPLLLLTNLGAGHSGASGRYDRLREIAVDYAFLLWQHGLAPGVSA